MARILVIDDNDTLREGVAQVIRKMGHEALTASGGARGIRLYQKYDIDFTITDLKMDDVDGMVVLNTIRKNDPSGLIIIAGMQQYAFDAPTQIAFMLRYKQENGAYPTNVMLNYHPYQALGQGPEKSLLPTLRMLLAGKTMAPVIFTEV